MVQLEEILLLIEEDRDENKTTGFLIQLKFPNFVLSANRII